MILDSGYPIEDLHIICEHEEFSNHPPTYVIHVQTNNNGPKCDPWVTPDVAQFLQQYLMVYFNHCVSIALDTA